MQKNVSSQTSTTHKSESKIKLEVREILERIGWILFDLIVSNKSGFPDTVANGPDARTVYIETKTKNGVVRKLQAFRHAQLRHKGFEVIVARDKADVLHLTR